MIIFVDVWSLQEFYYNYFMMWNQQWMQQLNVGQMFTKTEKAVEQIALL